MEKERELRRAKGLALAFFGGAACLFVLSLVLPQNWWTGLLRAFAEAAMVGALADWFAVVALFRKVPIPIVSRHTNIIPNNKERIADNLALFVRDKFLDTESLVALIRRHDPAQILSRWLRAPENAERLGEHLARFSLWLLDAMEGPAMQEFVRKAVHRMIGSVDLSQSAGTILQSLTRNGRHQELLDEGLRQLAGVLANEETQAFISRGLLDWFKEEYPFVERMLPAEATGMVGRKGADLLVSVGARILARVSEDPQHPIRQRFDTFTADFIDRLQRDPAFIEKGEDIKRYLLGDDTLNGYIGSLWTDLKHWLKDGLEGEDAPLRRRVVGAGAWVGQALADDARLREALNRNAEELVRWFGPEVAQFLTVHIADTVKHWDSAEMSHQVEINIGKDLQYIRINGTLVGGLIGVLLYLLSHLPRVLG